MKTEFEIKVLDIDAAKLREELARLGFIKSGDLAFRRYVYDLPTDGAWLRLRTDGSKTTITYKHSGADAIDGVQELEIVVEDFEATNQLLGLMGFKPRQYQENNRELYTKDGVEVSVDSWPLIPPYAEIEAGSEAVVRDTLKELNLTDAKTTSLPTSKVYERYGLDLDSYEHLAFPQ